MWNFICLKTNEGELNQYGLGMWKWLGRSCARLVLLLHRSIWVTCEPSTLFVVSPKVAASHVESCLSNQSYNFQLQGVMGWLQATKLACTGGVSTKKHPNFMLTLFAFGLTSCVFGGSENYLYCMVYFRFSSRITELGER
jgi:hypothetical protein